MSTETGDPGEAPAPEDAARAARRAAEDLGWRPDVLGAPFRAKTLPLADDDEGPCVATLVDAGRPPYWAGRFGLAAEIDVLYVHGWSDYFFQTELAEFWRERGARFFALDLRKYGRSLRPGQSPGYITDLGEYDEEIEAALTEMGHGRHRPTPSPRRLVLLGHSTGGLVLSLFAARFPGRTHALILNSPWLELQTREVGRMALSPLISTVGRLNPKTNLKNTDPGFYVQAVSKRFRGEWELNAEWRPDHSFPIYAAWLQAIVRGHERVSRGLDLSLPTLVLLAKRSVFALNWDDSMLSSDIVLDVEGIARRALDLGEQTTVVRVPNAMHDIFLSRLPVRQHAYRHLEHWLRGYRR
ncbi:alpha/beta hydrolase [Leucobacter sp. M11]|uniref:alpha/beta hydrolase n=1 Tax=Leucobacter sp. M11 TaxID=2993565 RepID=UPI002D7F2CD1|nr:alpha/beta hydrolase [Leucobacter sp. M11]